MRGTFAAIARNIQSRNVISQTSISLRVDLLKSLPLIRSPVKGLISPAFPVILYPSYSTYDFSTFLIPEGYASKSVYPKLGPLSL